jgi:hypothetical protein
MEAALVFLSGQVIPGAFEKAFQRKTQAYPRLAGRAFVDNGGFSWGNRKIFTKDNLKNIWVRKKEV